MKISTLVSGVLVALAAYSPLSEAHRVWIKPSTTVVSGDSEWITFDAAIANGIFNPDHYAYPLERLSALSPSGSKVELKNATKLKYRSVFDIELNQQGTYKVFNQSRSLVARWTDENGKKHYWPGRGKTGSVEAFNKEVPKTAKDLSVSDVARRLEVFVTLGAPNNTALEPTGKGLELNPVTHPNDLYTGEPITLQYTMDGEPAKGAEVIVVRQDEKYRDNSQPSKYTTNVKGEVTLTLSEPGMYWFEVEYEDDKAQAPATKRTGSYVTTLEVLPL
ncbi:DUF4198 domain-containing protein [Pseudoalteromonas sp. J010]|uniref:DUF4198 domain-containing protein n=1 Tax=Pseudoalteromonas sp. J010 TaxID=998465 RepID=UPI000F651982|nr:DUF4198 domain-containing protein [Pseudoalteromonas sp. J010]RRS09797.1 DUF4198 domain-containing protein [Pseudoalteromonas sp. J010]